MEEAISIILEEYKCFTYGGSLSNYFSKHVAYYRTLQLKRTGSEIIGCGDIIQTHKISKDY